MSKYSLINLLDIENSAKGNVDGRFARKFLESRDLGVSLFRYAPNTRNPISHSHEVQEEAYVVIKGSGTIRLDDEVRDIKELDVVRVAPEVVRGFEAGPNGLDLICVGGPKPEGGDGVIDESPWPKA